MANRISTNVLLAKLLEYGALSTIKTTGDKGKGFIRVYKYEIYEHLYESGVGMSQTINQCREAEIRNFLDNCAMLFDQGVEEIFDAILFKYGIID